MTNDFTARAAGWLSGLLDDLTTYLFLALTSLWSRVRGLRGSGRRDALAVYRVYVFRDSDADDDNAAAEELEPAEADGLEPAADADGPHTADEHHFHELPARFFNPDTWESDALDATGWGRVRVEVRYRQGGQKYRMVLRPGDPCIFPPPPRPRGFALAVLTANLQGRGGVDTDVTRRVLKYQGPNRDFHGTRVTVRDLFPFDDHDANATRFTHLRVLDSLARSCDIPYASGDHVLRAPWGSGGMPRQMPGLASINGSVASASVFG